MGVKCLLLVLFCILHSVRKAEGARILGIFPLQARSHFIMYNEVMKALADAGHKVDVVSHFPQKKPYPNYSDIVDLHGSLPILVNNITYEAMLPLQSLSFKTLVYLAGTEICGLLELPGMQKLIKDPPADPPYDLVITEFFFANCYFAFGRHLNIPIVALSSAAGMSHTNEAFGNPLNPAIVSEIVERPASAMTYWQRLKNTMCILFMNTEIKYNMRVQNDIVKKHFGSEMPDIEQLERELSLFLVNSHPIFHGVRPMTPAVVEVSGLHIRDDDTPMPKEMQKWLDDSKHGFIFFSLGSMVKFESFPKAALAEVYSAFAKVAPIRILMKVASPEELPPGLPDNVLILTWVPQVRVLKHKNIRGFMTHGGLMGLQEAVTFAVPLIGIPLFGDQMGNIDICVHRGIAVALDYANLNADEIIAAINAVAHDPNYKNNMIRISKQFMDRPRTAKESTVFWIEYILKHGEDALRSPAVKLTWWQLALLDVYGSIIAVVLIILYVLKRIISVIFNRFLHRNRAPTQSKKWN